MQLSCYSFKLYGKTTVTGMNYQDKKNLFRKMLTIYGRKPVLEALQNPAITCHKLHLAKSNKPAAIIQECLENAREKNIEINQLSKEALSRISKNAKQDQGIALDILLPESKLITEVTEKEKRLLLLDNVTNPQNVGMIIRNAAAGFIDGVIIPKKGTAELGPLVIKASAGTLFKAPIIQVDSTIEAIEALKSTHRITALALNDSQPLSSINDEKPRLFILGNETKGVSTEILKKVDEKIHIPMNREVESLNVAITAALIAFQPIF